MTRRIELELRGYGKKEWKKLRDACNFSYYQQEMIEVGRTAELRVFEILILTRYLNIKLSDIIPDRPKPIVQSNEIVSEIL